MTRTQIVKCVAVGSLIAAILLLPGCNTSGVANESPDGDRDQEAVDDGTAYSKARRIAEENNLDTESARNLCGATVLMAGYDKELQDEQLRRCLLAYLNHPGIAGDSIS